LGSVALPLTNGFIGEFLMLKSIFDFNNILGIVAGLSIILGAVYMLRFFQKTIFGDLNAKNEQIADLTSTEMWVLVPIAIVVLVTGLFPSLILEISEPFANALSNITK
jgi:NADH-quinone oxidoreductase subunit M